MNLHHVCTSSPTRLRISAAAYRMLRVTTFFDLFLTIAIFALTATSEQPATIVAYTLLRAVSRLPLDHATLLAWARWTHAYLLTFGWLTTAHCASPEGAPLLTASRQRLDLRHPPRGSPSNSRMAATSGCPRG